MNSLNDVVAAKKILLVTLDPRRAQLEGIQEYKCDLTEEQREILLEFLIFHIMVPTDELKEAANYLEYDTTLPDWKKKVCFSGMVKERNVRNSACLIGVRSHKQEDGEWRVKNASSPINQQQGWVDYLKQIEEHNVVQQAASSRKPETSPNSKQLNSHSKPNDNSWVRQAAALIFKSRNMASYFVLALRKQPNSRLGLLACSVILAFATSIYLLNLWRGRRMLTNGTSPIRRSNWGRSFAGVAALLADAFTFR